MWVIFAGMPAYFLFVWMSAAFRAVGDAQTPLRLLAVAAAVNLVVDPILIFGLGPLPALGVAGAALATVASWLVASASGLGPARTARHPTTGLRFSCAHRWMRPGGRSRSVCRSLSRGRCFR